MREGKEDLKDNGREKYKMIRFHGGKRRALNAKQKHNISWKM